MIGGGDLGFFTLLMLESCPCEAPCFERPAGQASKAGHGSGGDQDTHTRAYCFYTNSSYGDTTLCAWIAPDFPRVLPCTRGLAKPALCDAFGLLRIVCARPKHRSIHKQHL